MAETQTVIDKIDPEADYPMATLSPKHVPRDAVDPDRVVFSYDRRSDTLLALLFGPDRHGISVWLGGWAYEVVEPETGEVVGLHIEGFLSQAVKQHPWMVSLLEHAELRGITPAEVRRLERQVLRPRRRFGSWIRSLKVRPEEQKRRVVADSLEASGLLA